MGKGAHGGHRGGHRGHHGFHGRGHGGGPFGPLGLLCEMICLCMNTRAARIIRSTRVGSATGGRKRSRPAADESIDRASIPRRRPLRDALRLAAAAAAAAAAGLRPGAGRPEPHVPGAAAALQRLGRADA